MIDVDANCPEPNEFCPLRENRAEILALMHRGRNGGIVIRQLHIWMLAAIIGASFSVSTTGLFIALEAREIAKSLPPRELTDRVTKAESKISAVEILAQIPDPKTTERLVRIETMVGLLFEDRFGVTPPLKGRKQ